MPTITIDPITRIEGHLRIDLEVEAGTVVAARSAGTSFRGIETILGGRDPRDAPHITQRLCGVCPIPHGRASAEAIETALGIVVNEQARLVRNALQACNFIDSHLAQFYFFTLPDFVTGIPTALHPVAQTPSALDGRAVDAARLASHVQLALATRRACHAVEALLGGRFPHPVGVVVGGTTTTLSREQLDGARDLITNMMQFVTDTYPSDVQSLVEAYPEYVELGGSGAALLSFGAFPDGDGIPFFEAGVAAADSNQVSAPDVDALTESVASSHYEAATPTHPSAGETRPAHGREGAYSWCKAPRLGGDPCEVGPLARAVIAGRDPGSRGVWARHLARAEETGVVAAQLEGWLATVQPETTGLEAGFVPAESGTGAAFSEAPRGALGHWTEISEQRIVRYAIVSPTTWNASPRDELGQPGPIEAALVGVPIADPDHPVEAVRVVHSFDPCVQCAVH